MVSAWRRCSPNWNSDTACRFVLSSTSDGQLKAAKKQIKGQIGVACDNRENFALDFGKSFLHYGWEKNVDRLYEQLHVRGACVNQPGG